MVYEQYYTMLYNSGVHVGVRMIFWSFLFLIFYYSFLYVVGIFNKPVIPLMLFEYQKIIANSAPLTSLAICHLIFNVHPWNNC